MRGLAWVSGAGLVAALGLGQWLVRAQEHASTRDGVYTESQASRGQASYKTACASCHGETLEGSGAATPPLVGPDFTMNWTGQTLDDLFERIQTTMPGDHPGKLSREENAGILAYILKVNKLPAGQTDLPTSADALKQIQFEAPKE
ncbi:MAG TPA: cytochrome c [Bryobacteraceae bacterium]|nr:cytochrome c [Bryobacteraceae bacterium]